MITKVCSKCGEEKSIDQYQVNRQCKHGKRPECKACMKKYAADWRIKNLDKVTTKKNEYYEKNKDKIQEQHRDYIARNKEAVFKRHKDYRTKNKEKIKAWFVATPRGALSKTIKLGLRRRPTQNAATVDQLMDMWKAQGGRCAISGVTMTWCSGKTLPTSISLDRIDIERGYSIDNLRLVCYQVNCFRNRWSDDDMLYMASAIVTNMRQAKLRLVS